MDFLSFVAIVLLGILVLLFVRTHQVEQKPEQAEFEKGAMPLSLPSGFISGTVPGHGQVAGWQGKTFNTATMTGFNVLLQGGKRVEKFSFKLVPSAGIRDTKLQVMRIEYDIPGNPFWLRRVVDEFVETAPGKYVGKAHMRILPGIPFTAGFFRLEKTATV